jgi:hypothetical protein
MQVIAMMGACPRVSKTINQDLQKVVTIIKIQHILLFQPSATIYALAYRQEIALVSIEKATLSCDSLLNYWPSR